MLIEYPGKCSWATLDQFCVLQNFVKVMYSAEAHSAALMMGNEGLNAFLQSGVKYLTYVTWINFSHLYHTSHNSFSSPCQGSTLYTTLCYTAFVTARCSVLCMRGYFPEVINDRAVCFHLYIRYVKCFMAYFLQDWWRQILAWEWDQRLLLKVSCFQESKPEWYLVLYSFVI